MYGLSIFHLAWALIGLYLLVGLLVHERTGMRLGGILVLPLLLIYALFDLRTLVGFGIATLASFAVGSFFISRTPREGRGALYLFLLVGSIATAISTLLLGSEVTVFILALLPGLYAYNLYQERVWNRGVSPFAVSFAGLFAVTAVMLWSSQADPLPAMWSRVLPVGGILSAGLFAVASTKEARRDGGES